MIEAMACGTPVIGFTCGSVPEVVEEDVSGLELHALANILDIQKIINTEENVAASRL
jgi:glycosyltransferase involved in cell wall biosynthesis